MNSILRLAFLFLALLSLSGCGGGGGSSAPANIPPSANAGADQSVNEQTSVTLTGSAADSDGSVASTNWTQVSGTVVTINSSASTTATFTAPAIAVGSENLVFRLTVKDDKGVNASDEVTVTVNTTNNVPVANAGVDFTVDEQSQVSLVGTGTDDGSIAGYLWTQLSGTTVVLNAAATANAGFTAPSLSVAEDLTFSLTVTDDRGASNTDSIVVSVTPVVGLNTAPVANAGTAQTVVSAATVALDGSASADSDGSIVTYAWQQTAGATVVMTGANSSSAGFTAPTVLANAILTFMLTVTDNEGATNSVNVDITVTPLPAQVSISGKVTFDLVPFGAVARSGLDYPNLVQTGIAWATVEAIAGTQVVATTVSDVLGNYSLAVDPNTQIFIRVKAEMKKTGSPSWDVQIVDNTNAKALYVMDGSAFDSAVSNQTVDLNAASGWTGTGYGTTRVAAPFALMHTSFRAMSKILSANGSHIFTPLKINWSPSNVSASGSLTTGQIGTSFYSANEIYVLGDADTDTDEYDEHVIIHEWAHYFEDNFSRSDSIGGGHGGGDQLDMRLAFGEGWGNAWSGIATDDPVYRDSNGTAQGKDFSINVDVNSNVTPGWFSEGSVQSILYDLYDASDDGADTISMGFTPLYNVLINKEKNTPALTSIFSFITALKVENPTSVTAINALVSGQNINVTDEWGTGETNNAGDSQDVLPVYTNITTDGTVVNLCSSPAFKSTGTGGSNKLAVYRYLKFDVVTNGNYQINLTSATGSDPDYYLFKKGVFASGLSAASGTETGVHALTAGTHVLTVDDDKVVTEKTTVRTCIDIRVTAQ